MKLVIISDTHCTQPAVPDGDVLIHCGDHTYRGTYREAMPAFEWLNNLPHRHKIVIAGNHELGWEPENNARAMYVKDRVLEACPNLTYLEDSDIVIDGVKFWGSPYQPQFYNWAFQKARGAELQRHWAQIPDDTDVLITHGPPKGFGDMNLRDERFGDEDLLARVLTVKPDIHCYGHAHHGYGQWFHEGIHFINAAILNEQYMVANAPVEVEYVRE